MAEVPDAAGFLPANAGMNGHDLVAGGGIAVI
jgi:hypothetical protein